MKVDVEEETTSEARNHCHRTCHGTKYLMQDAWTVMGDLYHA
jgi:hypothetical protein